MGVQIYVLDRRTVTLKIGGRRLDIGTLRRSWKVTEFDEARASALEADRATLAEMPTPLAVLVADIVELPLASNSGHSVGAHIVLGWDLDRFEVTDFGWDHLPILGYAIRDPVSDEYVLHKECDGQLKPLGMQKAIETGVLDRTGSLIRLGQPIIVECRSVKPFISNYVTADCVLSNGQAAAILTKMAMGVSPVAQWYLGKRPSDAAKYISHVSQS